MATLTHKVLSGVILGRQAATPRQHARRLEVLKVRVMHAGLSALPLVLVFHGSQLEVSTAGSQVHEVTCSV